jgi:hypothetical protein
MWFVTLDPIKRRRWMVAGVFTLALLLRLWSAWHLPEDYDEPIYLQVGYDYAQLLHDGDLQGLIDYPENSEHPPLVKLLYAFGILAQGPGTSWEQALASSRVISAVPGAVAAGLVAFVDPLAGILVAVQTLLVKYTSQAYLEALPLMASIGAVLALRYSKQSRDRWFWLSAIALGTAAAGKFSYFPIAVVIGYIFLWDKRYSFVSGLLYLALAGITLLALDPVLWSNPIQRLGDALLFHVQYSQSAHVVETAYPWYQPFLWISRSWGYEWHPDVIFYFGFDGLIALLSVVGLGLAWKQNRWVIVWFISGLAFLLLWPTKWPQYTLVMLPSMCLLAPLTLRIIYQKLREQETYWEWWSTMFPRPSRRFLIIAGAVVAGMLLIGGINSLVLGLGRVGWSELTTRTTGLPSNMVYDLVSLPDGGMAIATEQGLALWHPASADDLFDQWTIFDPTNSPLPARRVLSLAYEPDGGILWVGTVNGLARYKAGDWQIIRVKDLGLEGDQVNALALGSDHRLWVATMTGVAVQSGTGWVAYTLGNSELPGESIFSLAVQPGISGDVLWFGALDGVSAFDTTNGEWERYTARDLNLGWGGVADLLADSRGRVWIATLGGGISRWEGDHWTALTTTNSDLPYNSVSEIAEDMDGEIWLSGTKPDESGGVLVRVVDDGWQVYRPFLSGFTGGEVMAVAQDATGRMWFATRTTGINIFDERR